MRRSVLLGLLLIASGAPVQAQMQLAPPEQNAMGKKFNGPPSGLAALYFFNPSAAAWPIAVFTGPDRIGELGPNTWMRVELSPGWHEMRCRTPDAANPTSITLAPGDIRFVAVQQQAGEPDCSISEAPTEVGRNAVLQGTRAFQRQ